MECDLESWFAKWQKGGPNRHLVLVELSASLRKAIRKPVAAPVPVELDPPEAATITAYDERDCVGRLRLESGEEFRFGASACKGFRPSLGAQVFVTAVSPHPLGGRKAVTVRPTPTTEAAVRAEADSLAAERAAEAERERQARREKAVSTTTREAIVARIRASVMPEEDDDADEALIYELIDDLELTAPTFAHVEAILQGIAESPAMAHFGSPGPLVHYAERFAGKGYEEALFEVSRARPTSHFHWMLRRIVNAEGAYSEEARAIIRSYVAHPQTPEDLRALIMRESM